MSDTRRQAWIAATVAALGTIGCQSTKEAGADKASASSQQANAKAQAPHGPGHEAIPEVGKPADGEPTSKECCMGKNDCKGQGGCAVEGKNSCAGKNDCKGQGGCNMHCPK